ncbi:MAG TPA: hypothetical protein VFQ30_11735, partial [Ktedonobacteraceae bacterium]|nr:hypothetical protein [Ktedonobacteraceae bacterium]
GYDSIFEASKHMARLREQAYEPIPRHQEIYDQLYREYVTLYDYFGRGGNDVMKRLKRLREDMLAEPHTEETQHARPA